MAETDSKTWKLKMKHSPMVLMNRVDYETAANAYLYSLGVKMADEDVSFLLGKPDNYFFDTLDPTEKTQSPSFATWVIEASDCIATIASY